MSKDLEDSTKLASQVIIGSGNGLSPVQCHAITCSSAGHLWKDFSDIWMETQKFSFKKMHFEKAVCKMPTIPISSLSVLIIFHYGARTKCQAEDQVTK